MPEARLFQSEAQIARIGWQKRLQEHQATITGFFLHGTKNCNSGLKMKTGLEARRRIHQS